MKAARAFTVVLVAALLLPMTAPGRKRALAGRLIAAGEGSVWVTTQRDGHLARIDPETNELVALIVAGGSLWISDHDVTTVYRYPLEGS